MWILTDALRKNSFAFFVGSYAAPFTPWRPEESTGPRWEFITAHCDNFKSTSDVKPAPTDPPQYGPPPPSSLHLIFFFLSFIQFVSSALSSCPTEVITLHCHLCHLTPHTRIHLKKNVLRYFNFQLHRWIHDSWNHHLFFGWVVFGRRKAPTRREAGLTYHLAGSLLASGS